MNPPTTTPGLGIGLGPPLRPELLAPVPRTREDLLAAQAGFAWALGRASAAGPRSREEQARDAAEQFVSQTFVQPLLKQFRESDRTPAPFGPSQGEKQFRALLDAELAHRITKAQRFPLVDRLARDLLRRSDGPSAPGP